MKLYSENENYKLYQGSMLDMLEVIEPNTIDSIITDPPYELNFMNKGWDNSGIAFQKETWQKCYEALKPGSYLLAFGGSRTFHRIACAIEDAGFEIRDTIMWLYGSGFPKSMDISKQIDKRADNNNKVIKEKEELGNYLKEKIIDTDNICAEKIGFSPALVRFWKLGERIPNKETWLKLKSIYDLDDRYDYLIEDRPSNYIEAEREVIGKKEYTNDKNVMNISNYNGERVHLDITIPSTDLAKQWQGWGTALKPSFEPIIVARKPFKGSLVDNVIEYGVGGINIDECRVEPTGEDIGRNNYINPYSSGRCMHISNTPAQNSIGRYEGRFPANTILTYNDTDFDEVCGGFPNTKSNGGKTSMPDLRDVGKKSKEAIGIDKLSFGQVSNVERKESNYIAPRDSGSASRYFYCAKASKKDRDEGLDEFEEKRKAGYGYDLGYMNAGEGMFKESETLKKNTHPTVKPTELMQYLVRLVSPDGATILDCFNGSGSTGKAVMYENLEKNKNYKYIGIELTEEYLPIAKARIEYICNLVEEEKNNLTIFDFIDK